MGRDLNFKRASKEGYMEDAMEGEKGKWCDYAII